jgi:pimeloyl-ACP methyl ester carboxylesterase
VRERRTWQQLMETSVRQQFVDTRFGRINVLRGGSGETSIVLIHTVGGSSKEFASTFPALTDRFDVIAWDMPGHGDSTMVPDRLSIEGFADALTEVLGLLDVASPWLAGSSIGGPIAVAAALSPALQPAGVCLVEAPVRTAAEWESGWPRIEARFAIPTQTAAEVASRVNSLDDQFLLEWNVDRNKAGSRNMVQAMWALREYDMRAQLATITCPIAAIYGDKGPNPDAPSRIESIAGIKVAIIDNCGHFPYYDQPARFNELLSLACS